MLGQTRGLRKGFLATPGFNRNDCAQRKEKRKITKSLFSSTDTVHCGVGNGGRSVSPRDLCVQCPPPRGLVGVGVSVPLNWGQVGTEHEGVWGCLAGSSGPSEGEVC